MVWIHTLAGCKDEMFAFRFPLSRAKNEGPGLDADLRHILRINQVFPSRYWQVTDLLATDPEHTPSHTQWVSDVLLRHFWAAWFRPSDEDIVDWISNAHETQIVISLDVTLNRLLLWCAIFGSPPAEEALMVKNKPYDTSCLLFKSLTALFTSDCLCRILSQFSEAVLSSVNGDQRRLIPDALRDLAKLEIRPPCLTEFV